MNGCTSKSGTSAAILTGWLEASKLRIGPTPLRPFLHADQNASLPVPLGATTPRPVTTTLRIGSTRLRDRLRAQLRGCVAHRPPGAASPRSSALTGPQRTSREEAMWDKGEDPS